MELLLSTHKKDLDLGSGCTREVTPLDVYDTEHIYSSQITFGQNAVVFCA